MILNADIAKQIAKSLLQIKAVVLQYIKGFTAIFGCGYLMALGLERAANEFADARFILCHENLAISPLANGPAVFQSAVFTFK